MFPFSRCGCGGIRSNLISLCLAGQPKSLAWSSMLDVWAVEILLMSAMGMTQASIWVAEYEVDH